MRCRYSQLTDNDGRKMKLIMLRVISIFNVTNIVINNRPCGFHKADGVIKTPARVKQLVRAYFGNILPGISKSKPVLQKTDV